MRLRTEMGKCFLCERTGCRTYTYAKETKTDSVITQLCKDCMDTIKGS